MSKFHEKHPYEFQTGSAVYRVEYLPGESNTDLFGGNSNWRGPVWLPLNYLLVEALERYHHFYGDDVRVECPTGSGKFMNLGEVSQELARRMRSIFLRDKTGRRPCHGEPARWMTDPNWRELLLFHEYFMARAAKAWLEPSDGLDCPRRIWEGAGKDH